MMWKLKRLRAAVGEVMGRGLENGTRRTTQNQCSRSSEQTWAM